MKLCCRTSSLKRIAWMRQWSQAEVYKALRDCEVEAVIADEADFNERAMYWTRIARKDLGDLGLDLLSVNTKMKMPVTAGREQDEQVANLMEWVRIAALSEIPFVDVELVGVCDGDWSPTRDALSRAAEYAGKYRTRLILVRKAERDREDVLALAKRIGYNACRVCVSGDAVVEGAAREWVGEVTASRVVSGKYPEDALFCIEPGDMGKPVEGIRQVVRSMKGKR